AQLVGGGNGIDGFKHEADEAVSFAFDSIHDLARIDSNGDLDTHAEWRRTPHGAGRLCRRNEQLRGHAADPGGHRSAWAALAQDRAAPGLLYGAVSGHARRTRANNRYIGFEGVHESSLASTDQPRQLYITCCLPASPLGDELAVVGALRRIGQSNGRADGQITHKPVLKRVKAK